MSQLKKTPFQLSFIALTVLSLSACSTTPNIAGVDLGKVGSKTVEISSNAWEGTKNFLNIGPKDAVILDEVDLALMDEGVTVHSVEVATVESEQILLPQNAATLSDAPNKPQAFGEVPVVLASANDDVMVLGENGELTRVASGDILVVEAETEVVPLADLTHEVAASETLWDIAKATTGDANNWHIIADINNLPPNASVFVGQKLIIPGDMVKPEFQNADGRSATQFEQGELSELVVTDASPAVKLSTEDAEAAVVLNIPAQSSVVVVAAESINSEGTAAPVVDAAYVMADATALKVANGETLWDFSKRTTGDATNWKMIAEKNMLTEKQIGSIRPGQKIYVPSDMIRARDENGVLIAEGDEGVLPTATAGDVTAQNKAAIDASTAVLAGTNVAVDGDIKIVEAAFQGDSGIKPVTAETLSTEASMAVDTGEQKLGAVMVRGTYYPKAVYNEADFSSSLLMRVSPGTELIVSEAIGPWLKVTTDKGVGYVHSRDIK